MILVRTAISERRSADSIATPDSVKAYGHTLEFFDLHPCSVTRNESLHPFRVTEGGMQWHTARRYGQR